MNSIIHHPPRFVSVFRIFGQQNCNIEINVDDDDNADDADVDDDDGMGWYNEWRFAFTRVTFAASLGQPMLQ